MAGIYVHIPFCRSRCIYCGFYSTTLVDVQGRYVDALIRELALRSDYLCEPVQTIYIGGGTPSTLTPDNLKRLCKALTKGNNVVEFTVECNPDDISREFAELLVECGVTRVSMGVQSFSDARLRFLHRRHNADTVQFAVRALRNAGIKNISIDLMFGFPGETLEDWEHDISKAIRLDIEHISAYSLQYEKDTPLNDMLEKGLITELDEEICRDMYYHLVDRLEAADYEHYEISNFAKRCYSDDEAKTYRSQHNSSYWQGIPYIGLGAAAHSFDKESRQWNVSDVFGYMDSILNDSKLAIEEREVLDDITKYNDLITTSMRTCEGIDLDTVSHKDYLLNNAKPLIEKGLLSIDNNHIHLTRSGLYVSDYIMTDLILLDK